MRRWFVKNCETDAPVIGFRAKRAVSSNVVRSPDLVECEGKYFESVEGRPLQLTYRRDGRFTGKILHHWKFRKRSGDPVPGMLLGGGGRRGLFQSARQGV